MSTTTQTQTSSVPMPSKHQSPPELTVLTRVASIPMISSSLSTLNDTLISNAYTRSPYSTAKGLSSTAYRYTAPLQIRLAPLITRADDIANKAVDAVESRYPYPFTAKPEEVAQLVRERRESAGNYVRERRQSAVDVANKNFDQKVKSPVVHVAQGIDQSFAPIVDYFEVAVTRFNHAEPGPPSPETKYQYQRAYALSMNLKDSLVEYSNEQLKQLQEHNALVRSATETAHNITALASSSLTHAQTRVHALSDTMLQELQKVQQSSAALSSSLASSLQSASTAQQQTFHELSTMLSSTITDLRGILAEHIPLNEKVSRVGVEVNNRVGPLLDNITRKVGEMLNIVRGRAEQVKTNGVNGHADGSTQ